jgi:thymidine kinase
VHPRQSIFPETAEKVSQNEKEETKKEKIMHRKGKITLIIGPMFAGKTTEMFRRVKRAIIAGQSSVVIKHELDTRYVENTKKRALASSHDAEKMKALSTGELLTLCERNDVKDAQLIGIDEGQFYPDLVEFALWAVNKGKDVVISGLDSDFRQQGFKPIVDLIPKADHVMKLHAICIQCGDEAAFSRKIDTLSSDDTQIDVGGAEKYVATCRTCFEAEIDSGKLNFHRNAMEKIKSLKE